jgi:hypothetical protein
MKGHPLHLYPVSLKLLDTDPSTASATIAIPPRLPWQQLWMSVGAVLYALSGAYSAAKNLLSDPSTPHTTDRVSVDDDLRVVRMSYNSPLDVEMIVGFTTAFSLVWAVTSEAITTTIKLLEWIENKKDLQGKRKLHNLEVELKQLELEEEKAQMTQESLRQLPAAASGLADPQLTIINRLFFLGSILAGKETEIWTTSSFGEGWGSDHQSRQWNDETEIRYGPFERDEEGRIWFQPVGAPRIIGGYQD